MLFVGVLLQKKLTDPLAKKDYIKMIAKKCKQKYILFVREMNT